MTYYFETEFEGDEGTVDLVISYEVHPGDPGRVFNCLPEDAYPPEPADVEIIKIETIETDAWGTVVHHASHEDDHTEHAESIEDKLIEHAAEQEAERDDI